MLVRSTLKVLSVSLAHASQRRSVAIIAACTKGMTLFER